MKKVPRSEQFGRRIGPPSVDGDDDREDPLNPAIPKAPLLPHDLHRMANAALPKWSNPPNDKGGDRQISTSQADFELLREHVDADPPPGVTPSTYDSAARAPHTDSIPEIGRRPDARPPAAPSRAIGPGTGTAAVRTAPESAPESSAGMSGTRWAIMVAVVLAAMGGLLWLLL
jgi:hypothetical protein